MQNCQPERWIFNYEDQFSTKKKIINNKKKILIKKLILNRIPKIEQLNFHLKNELLILNKKTNLLQDS